MRNVYIGMPRSGKSPSKVVSCTFLLHELPAEDCLYNIFNFYLRMSRKKAKAHIFAGVWTMHINFKPDCYLFIA